jgi:hypothetical protein
MLSWISLTLSSRYTIIYAHIPHTHTQCILGFAFAAAQRDWVEAVLVNEPVIYIEGGRHPLCELCVDTFVSATPLSVPIHTPIIIFRWQEHDQTRTVFLYPQKSTAL